MNTQAVTVSNALEKMVLFYRGSHPDISHTQKVWCFAKMIGELEELDDFTQLTLELAAVVHDIACPLCQEKYGSADGHYQELEGPAAAREFYAEFDLPKEQMERICFLVGHHHTTEAVDGIDYQILLEADFLVNADEMNAEREEIIRFRDKVFRTKTGRELLNSIYGLPS